tara:strand:+ start:809 stop:991 length:183 start_codon:yes stop_codon:yes gene_type:complete
MSKTRLISSVEITINEALKRYKKLEGRDKESILYEFKEWFESIDSDNNNYDILFIKRISE